MLQILNEPTGPEARLVELLIRATDETASPVRATDEEGETVGIYRTDIGGKDERCRVQVGVDVGAAAEEHGNDGGLKCRDESLALGFGVDDVRAAMPRHKLRKRKRSGNSPAL